MQKKLIGFDEELITQIENYSGDKTFTEAVRSLVMLGLKSITPPEQEQGDSNSPDMSSRVRNLEQEIIDLDKEIIDLDKKVNIVIAVSKNFKGHLNNREIHLQD